MKNREKYTDFLIECAIRGTGVAVTKDGKPCNCMDLECEDCLFNNPSVDCAEMTRKWSDSEYKELEVDWSKVPVDTKMWVKNHLVSDWIPRYFSGEINVEGIPLMYFAGVTSFSCERDEKGKPFTVPFPFYKFAEDI